MNTNQKWFDEFSQNSNYQAFKKNPIAYFCAEFAISDNLPIYAGGLGVLAGDLVKESFDQNFPLIAVGLYYYKGYQKNIEELSPSLDPTLADLEPVLDKNGDRLKIKIPSEDGEITIMGWLWSKGTIPIYLLDANLPENTLDDRKISSFLYALDRSTRLKQEMVLGIGGVRFLEALEIEPSKYHMNEGHSALLAFEIASKIMKKDNLSFSEAIEQAKAKIVFTNHTLVAAGHDLFKNEMFTWIMNNYSREIGVPVGDLLLTGLIYDANDFSMTMLALRYASKVNGVSIIHTAKANLVWKNHPLLSITNGIHIPTWDQIKEDDLLWQKHQENKENLLNLINKTHNLEWKKNELLIGWARRITDYKQPLVLFSDLEKLKKIAENSDRPVKFVFSGFPHFSDQEMIANVQKIKNYTQNELKGSLIFLDGYSLSISNQLISGCDVWLNTPIVGFEACGTSGMKAALNGALMLSTPDGWLPEVNLESMGWCIKNIQTNEDIINLLENNIVPLYYENYDQEHSHWVNMMKTSRATIQKDFSATRMLKDYIEKMYI